MPHKKSQKTLPATARSLPISLMRAREKAMAPIREMLSESGITEQQWRVLRVLSEHGATDATTLADRASLLYPSLTRIAQAMKAKGMISQEADTQDRRRQSIAITPAGQAVIDKHVAQSTRIVEQYKEKLGEENYEQLLDLLQILAEA